MGMPPASERGIPTGQEIKLIHELTTKDVGEIARITEGILSYSSAVRRHYETDQADNVLASFAIIEYPQLNAEIGFSGNSYIPDAYLIADYQRFRLSLERTAVFTEGDSVTFVHCPEAGLVEPNMQVATITISKDEITFRKTAYPLDGKRKPDGKVLEALSMLDEAFFTARK